MERKFRSLAARSLAPRILALLRRGRRCAAKVPYMRTTEDDMNAY